MDQYVNCCPSKAARGVVGALEEVAAMSKKLPWQQFPGADSGQKSWPWGPSRREHDPVGCAGIQSQSRPLGWSCGSPLPAQVFVMSREHISVTWGKSCPAQAALSPYVNVAQPGF